MSTIELYGYPTSIASWVVWLVLALIIFAALMVACVRLGAFNDAPSDALWMGDHPDEQQQLRHVCVDRDCAATKRMGGHVVGFPFDCKWFEA